MKPPTSDAVEADKSGRNHLPTLARPGGADSGAAERSPPSRLAPVRVRVSASVLMDSDVVYIGRGDRRLGLRPSIWGNPHKIAGQVSRADALMLYKCTILQSSDLLEKVASLGGKRLACHCPTGLPCHGDVLREIYEETYLDNMANPPTDQQARLAAEERNTLLQSGPGTRAVPHCAEWKATRVMMAGEPLMVGHGVKRRILVDGGGLCSPGLWRPRDRDPPPAVAGKLFKTLELAYSEQCLNEQDLLGRLLQGAVTEPPFSQDAIDSARVGLKAILQSELESWMPIAPPRGQLIEMRLIGCMLRAIGDPDWEIFRELEAGVRLGVGVELPRTPKVFPEKRKWSLSSQADAVPGGAIDGAWRTNYVSAKNHVEEVKKVLEDQAARRYPQVIVLPEEEATKKYGRALSVASLGAVEKGTRDDGTVEVRIVHDGTNGVQVNSEIKVRDLVTSPSAADLKCVIRECASIGSPVFGLAADVQEAHRQIQVREEDWMHQACQLEEHGPIYLNCVGTYGLASAGYWWGRCAAGIHRLMYAIFGQSYMLWLLLFADDWLILSGGRHFKQGLLYPIFFLQVLGVPLSWRKVQGGFTTTWIGYEIDLRGWSLGISERRSAWLLKWFDETLVAGTVRISELGQVVGRMAFVYGALTWDRPFLAPLYTLIALHPPAHTVPLPHFVSSTLRWLRDRLRARRSHPCNVKLVQKGVFFRVDAKAEGSEVAIGGWAPCRDQDGQIDLAASPWFAVALTEQSAPWAFHRGEPYKAIAALELLATVVALLVFTPSEPAGNCGRGTIVVTGQTDSQVASQVLGRAMTTSYPLCLIAMEAAAQMEARRLDLELEWVPRTHNVEADALSNLEFAGFDVSLRREVDLTSISFLVLPTLQAAAAHFYNGAGTGQPTGQARGRKRRVGSSASAAPLKIRQPW